MSAGSKCSQALYLPGLMRYKAAVFYEKLQGYCALTRIASALL